MIISKLFLSVLLMIAGNHLCNGEFEQSSLLGGDISERIKRGRIVQDRTMFPYAVHLSFFKNEDGKLKPFSCGGSLIQPNWVLTAAHCCIFSEKVKTAFGTISSHPRNGVGYELEITKDNIHAHNEYTKSSKSHADICLIKLPNNQTLNSDVNTIGLVEDKNADPDAYVGRNVTISGWGHYDNYHPPSTNLRYGFASIIPLKECESVYNDKITKENICVSRRRYGSCSGDSGSAMTIVGSDGKAQLIGVVSFGKGGCTSNVPTVYTNVPFYSDWISKTITQYSS